MWRLLASTLLVVPLWACTSGQDPVKPAVQPVVEKQPPVRMAQTNQKQYSRRSKSCVFDVFPVFQGITEGQTARTFECVNMPRGRPAFVRLVGGFDMPLASTRGHAFVVQLELRNNDGTFACSPLNPPCSVNNGGQGPARFNISTGESLIAPNGRYIASLRLYSAWSGETNNPRHPINAVAGAQIEIVSQ